MIMIFYNTIKSVIYIIVAFLIMFNPPIIKGFSFSTTFVLIAFFYNIINVNWVLLLLKNAYIKNFVLGILLLIYYSIFVAVLNYKDECYNEFVIGNVLDLIVNNVSVIMLSFAIVIFFLKRSLSLSDMFNTIIGAGMAQSVIGIACFFSPGVKAFFNFLTISNSNSYKIATSMKFTSEYRNFGFASSLYDIFGLTMSLIALFALAQAIDGKKHYYIYFFLIGFTAIINARTGVVIITVGATILYFLSSLKLNKVEIGKFFSFIALGIVVFVIMAAFSEIEMNNTQRLFNGINEITTLMFQHESTGYFATLFNDFLFFPTEFFNLIWGTGLIPAQAISRTSDVGYIQNIWQFGVVGSIILYRIYIRLFLFLPKNENNKYRSMAYVLGVSVALYLIKLNCLGYSMSSVFFLPFLFYSAMLYPTYNTEIRYNQVLLTK